jgi:hypothetical protein
MHETLKLPMQKISTFSKKSVKRNYSKLTEIGPEPSRDALKNILAFSLSIETKKCKTGQTILYILN